MNKVILWARSNFIRDQQILPWHVRGICFVRQPDILGSNFISRVTARKSNVKIISFQTYKHAYSDNNGL